jgi:diacylglycerol O-acyltransferase
VDRQDQGGVAVTDRLSSLDVSFLYLEHPSTAMHVGSVMIFTTPSSGLDVERFTRHVGSRIAFVPRYRQRIRTIPGRIANPVWVDDEHFDLSYHIRRSALPRPGSDAQLEELVARLQSRPLDRRRPLWELYLVEGLSDGRFALISKVHQALVDGVHTVDLGQVILDDTPDAADPPVFNWQAVAEPTTVELLVGAVIDNVRRPGQVVDAVRNGLVDVRDTAAFTARTAGRVVRAARRVAGGPPKSPLTQPITAHRRFAMITTDLEDYRTIRAKVTQPDPQPRPHSQSQSRPSGHSQSGSGVRPLEAATPVVSITVNDVVLAVLAGALRAWLLARGEPVPTGSIVRTLVPMSVRVDDPAAAGAIGSRVDSILVDLPTGEASPMMRLHQVAYQTKGHRETGQAVDAPSLAGIAGFAPPTLHSLGARVASGISQRIFHLVVTNVPGPQQPLYVDGARMVGTYPVVPLAAGQALSIGLTSYAGKVYYGLNADREAMPDVDVVGQCIVDALAEFMEAVR